MPAAKVLAKGFLKLQGLCTILTFLSFFCVSNNCEAIKIIAVCKPHIHPCQNIPDNNIILLQSYLVNLFKHYTQDYATKLGHDL